MPSPSPAPTGVALLVPVKAFDQAKGRLAGMLSPLERAELARHLATGVVRAGAGMPVHVVCDDRAVARWAETAGAVVLWRPGRGLNQAVTDGVEALRRRGYRRAVVAHADLPLATSLSWVGAFGGVTIVPDRRDDGTNVIAVPVDARFEFSYGAASFRQHADRARRLGLAVRVVRDPDLGFDVDVPADLTTAALTDATLRRFVPIGPRLS